MSLEDLVCRYSALPRSSVRKWESGSISELGQAILFILAPWSGPSISRFARLTKFLAQAPSPPPVVVADIDALTPAVLHLLGDNLRGVGEMYWIRNGKIVASIADVTDENGLEDSISANNLILSETG